MKLNKLTTAFSRILFSLLLIGGLAACSDDDNNGKEEPEPAVHPVTSFSKIQLKEVVESDAEPVIVTQTYLYDKSGRLYSYTYLQNFNAGGETFEIEGGSSVEYSDHQAVVTDDTGTVSTYTLNDKGYAVNCTRQEPGANLRTYTFSYLVNTEDKHYLTNITEKLGDGAVYSSVDIEFSGFRSIHIKQKVGDFEHAGTAITSPGDEIANVSEIPYPYLADQHPLSMHTVAIYGKLLGEPFDYLITQLSPDNNEESKEITTYTYTLDDRGIVTSCREVTNSYGVDYRRTVNYTIE
ncbi:DUF4595 domain-containing protein [Bacteroides sp. GD17]|jgi:hypothetical protein|uniref:DUF4595 domain-containing protein n=1 Tax=Bacteroides sp. GD17 TaxID=3139826 RepID=UPI0025E7D940|nr:DUF4595 domain-containing protein [uncultured Bacteroides sp.]